MYFAFRKIKKELHCCTKARDRTSVDFARSGLHYVFSQISLKFHGSLDFPCVKTELKTAVWRGECVRARGACVAKRNNIQYNIIYDLIYESVGEGGGRRAAVRNLKSSETAILYRLSRAIAAINGGTPVLRSE